VAAGARTGPGALPVRKLRRGSSAPAGDGAAGPCGQPASESRDPWQAPGPSSPPALAAAGMDLASEGPPVKFARKPFCVPARRASLLD
jgi:hypothetical protein